MNRSPQVISRRLKFVLLAAAIGGLAAAAAEQVIVRTEVNVKSDKNPFADPVETVATNTPLDVLAHEEGWMRVRTPAGKEGYISDDDLPPKVNLAAVQGSGKAGGVSNDAALRGLQDETEGYARSKRWTTAGTEQMIAWGKSVTENDLIAFGKAGHVGPAKYRR